MSPSVSEAALGTLSPRPSAAFRRDRHTSSWRGAPCLDGRAHRDVSRAFRHHAGRPCDGSAGGFDARLEACSRAACGHCATPGSSARHGCGVGGAPRGRRPGSEPAPTSQRQASAQPHGGRGQPSTGCPGGWLGEAQGPARVEKGLFLNVLVTRPGSVPGRPRLRRHRVTPPQRVGQAGGRPRRRPSCGEGLETGR